MTGGGDLSPRQRFKHSAVWFPPVHAAAEAAVCAVAPKLRKGELQPILLVWLQLQLGKAGCVGHIALVAG